MTTPAAQQFSSNQFNNNVPIQGDTCFVEGFNVLPVMIDPNSVNTLVPSDAVVLTTTAGTAIFVDRATATEVPFGFVLYNMQTNEFTAGDALEIARFGTAIWAQAGGAITRGDDLNYVPDTSDSGTAIVPTMINNNGTDPISAIALDNASEGGLFRMIIATAVDFAPTITGGSINNTPIGASTPSTGNFTALTTVVTALTPGASVAINAALGGLFTLTPGQNETITVSGGVAGQQIQLIVKTSGTSPYTLTFSTGFAGIVELNTGAVSAVEYVLSFVFDGTNFVLSTTLAKAIYAITPGATIAIDPNIGDVQTLVPGGNETLNCATLVAGKRLTFVITTSGTSSFTLTFGTNFKSTGTLATGTSSGKVFVIEFICDGVNYNEVARTTAM